MKRIYLIFNMLALMLLFNNTWAQGLLLEENFDYTAGELLTAHGWTAHSAGGTNAIAVANSGISYSNYISSGIGNNASMTTSGEDDNKAFTSTNSGSVYVAFLVNITAASTTGDYFIHFCQTSGVAAAGFYARVFVKRDASNNLAFGIAKSGTTANYTGFTYALNTTYLVVAKYTFVSGTTNDYADLFVNPVIGSPEPLPTVTCTDITGTDGTALSGICLRQGTASNAPTPLVDGIRVATTWEEAVKAPDTQAPVAVFNPANAATDVAVNVNPTISFDEAIRNIDNTVIDNSNVASLITFKLTDAAGADVLFTATIDATSKIITVVPSSNLAFNQTYYLAIASVEDASDNATVTQSINFTTIAASTAAEITSFDISGEVSSNINSAGASVAVVMPYGTSLTSLTPAIAVSNGATINPASGIAQNFSSSVLYTVTAQDGTTNKDWTVSVSNAPANTDATLSDLTVDGTTVTGFASGTYTYNVVLPYGTTTVPTVVGTPTDANATAAVTDATSLPGATTVLVTAQDGTTQLTYTINFSASTASNIANILTYSVGVAGEVVNISDPNITVTVPFGTNVSALVSTFTLTSGASAQIGTTAQVSGTTANDFTNPVVYTVTAEDGTTTKDWTVTVNIAAASTAADILTYSTGVAGENVSINEPNITVTVPFGTDVTALVSTFTLSAGASASVNSTAQVSGTTANDFTNPVVYTVTAEDGTTTKTWTVSVTVLPNTAADILTYSTGVVGESVNISDPNIAVSVPNGTDVTALVSTFTLSVGAGATVNSVAQVSGTTANDFTNPVIYTVTAEDGTTTKNWTVTVTVLPPVYETLVDWTFPNNPDDNIADGGITENLNRIISNNASAAIEYTYAGATTNSARSLGWDNGMNTKYWVVNFTTSGYKDITLSSKQKSSSTGPKDFKAQYSLDSLNWVDIAPVTTASNFTSGVLTDIALPAECNNQVKMYVRWIMTSNTAVNNSTVASGGASNIDDIYVKGVAFLSSDKEILAFDIPGQVAPSVINSTNATVDLTMPYGTDLTNLTPAITISGGASINPASGVAQNFSSAFQYTVTAADATTKTWTVNVATEAASNAAEILTFDITGQFSSTINSTNATVDIVMPMGTDLTNLTPTITISANATINPLSGIAQNFSSAVQYTVTAQDGTTNKVWTVNVSTQLNNQADIVTFDIPNQVSSTINAADTTVTVLMPYGTDVTALVPTITVSQGATISPLSGVAQDFTSVVQYTVTAENGTNQKVWNVNVTLDAPVYTTLVDWTFPNSPNDDSLADGGITANLDKIIIANTTGLVTYVPISSSTTSTARSTGWDNGMDSKYWMISFTTMGYKDITLSSKQRSSSTGPRDFKAQYSLDSIVWNDIATITAANNFTTGVLSNVALPAECNNQTLMYIRWIMTSNVQVDTTTTNPVPSTGVSNIDDIYVKGIEDPLSVQTINEESIVVYPNPTTEWLYIHSTDKISNVNIISLDGKVIPVIWNNDAIDVHSLTTGMYILNISTLNKTYKVNFVKQ